jgi:3-oxoadipate enol-lactonase
MLIQAAQRRIYYDIAGAETAPVVCLNHALSSDSGVWSDQLPALLAKGWRVLRIDMRGHGGSAPVAGDYAMTDLSNDVALVIDFLGLERVHFVGLSIGGMIGQTFAIEHPGRLVSLMLCGTSPAGIPGGTALWRSRFEAIDKAASVEPLADATMERWFTAAFKPLRPGRWAQIRETIARTSPEGYRGGGLAIDKFDVLGLLPAVRAPTLVVCGDDDQGTPPAGNKKIAELIPGARYEQIAKARHIANVEHPDTFNRILIEWLTSRM